MTFRRAHAVAALLTLIQTTIQAKDPRELTLELLSSRESWSGMKMVSRSGARYECSAGEARLASQVTQKTPPDKPETLATLLSKLDGQCAKLSRLVDVRVVPPEIRAPVPRAGVEDRPGLVAGPRYSRTKVKGDIDTERRRPDPALARDVFAEKGQICHETNTLRSTNVTFKCCEPDKRRRHRTYLVSVDEASLCNTKLWSVHRRYVHNQNHRRGTPRRPSY